MTQRMTYAEALDFIHGAYDSGEKDGLRNMQHLLARMQNPERGFRAFHVAGTNGKGSVCALLQAALRCAGLKTGLYTSPFLERYNERMRIDGAPIPDGTLAGLMEIIAPEVEALRAEGRNPTEFEIGTALAFLYFAREKVDAAVIEVGLGGRLDPTNVLKPIVCGISAIGLDHQHILGDTLAKIAAEKAGIAKPGVPLALSAQVVGEAYSAIEAACARVGAPLSVALPGVPYGVGLPGAHQAYNAGLALEMLRLSGLPVPEAATKAGFSRATWPGRLEWLLGGRLLLDGAHNVQGALALSEYVRSLPKRRTVLLCSIMKDKDIGEMTAIFSGIADAAVTVAPGYKRALPAETLAQAFAETGVPVEAAESMEAALKAAQTLAGVEGRIVAAGSLFLVGELRALSGAAENLLLLEA